MLSLPQITTVPAVIDGLVTAFAAITPDPAYLPFEVVDGPRSQANAHDLIAVAVGTPAVTHRWIRQNRGVAYDEAFDISCEHWAWSGSKVMKGHRDRSVVVLTAIRDILDSHPIANVELRLGDSLDWTFGVAGEGATSIVHFSIHGSASI